MILRARDDLGLDLSRSVLVGDKMSDILAAQAAGIPTRIRLGAPDAAPTTAPTQWSVAPSLDDIRTRFFTCSRNVQAHTKPLMLASLLGAIGPRPLAWLTTLLVASVVGLGNPLDAHAQPWSGVISPPRAIDWSNAGVSGGIPNRTTICATLGPGVTATQINNAISAARPGRSSSSPPAPTIFPAASRSGARATSPCEVPGRTRRSCSSRAA
jgi:hypothetical protein